MASVSLPAAASLRGGVPAKAVSGLSVGVSPPYPGAQANYFVDFKATAGAAAGGDVYLSGTARPSTKLDRNDRTGGRRDPGMAVPGLGRKVRVRREHRAAGLPRRGPERRRGDGGPAEGCHKGRRSRLCDGRGRHQPPRGRGQRLRCLHNRQPDSWARPLYRVLTWPRSSVPGARSHRAKTLLGLQAFRNAYGISPLLARGIDGRGRTVVLVEWLASGAGGDASSNIFVDMAEFDSYFHLPAVKLSVVPGPVPKAAADQAIVEELEDVEMVHAVATGAAASGLSSPVPARTQRAR